MAIIFAPPAIEKVISSNETICVIEMIYSPENVKDSMKEFSQYSKKYVYQMFWRSVTMTTPEDIFGVNGTLARMRGSQLPDRF